VEIDKHFIKQNLEEKIIRFIFVISEDQRAKILIKEFLVEFFMTPLTSWALKISIHLSLSLSLYIYIYIYLKVLKQLTREETHKAGKGAYHIPSKLLSLKWRYCIYLMLYMINGFCSVWYMRFPSTPAPSETMQ
jgi:hypothetical protein